MGKKVAPVVHTLSGGAVRYTGPCDQGKSRMLEEAFCEGCQFVRIMSDDGTGWCKEHGDINGGPSDDE